MNPQVNGTPGLDLPQPGSETNQLPSIHAPQTFHAPDTAIPKFDTAPSPMPTAPTVTPAQATAPAGAISSQPSSVAPQGNAPTAVPDPIAAATAQLTGSSLSAAQTEEVDTPFDEEWVAKAKEVVERTHADPYVQSRELGRLKAQYIKARYNKDIKVSED